LRSQQADDAIKCLESGFHVLAEKPSAIRVADIERIIQTAKKTGKIYHEQAATAFDQPYATLRKIVATGVLGPVIQVYAQKSYPWGDWRPQDENIDGGLALQAGVYATRFVEHVALVKIKSLTMKETRLGNPVADGQCRRAVSMLMELANGGLASAVVNYCCPPPEHWGRWGYETLRIFGANGFVESIDHGRIGTLALNNQPAQRVEFTDPSGDFLGMFIQEIRTGKKVIQFSLEEELSPTRWVVQAKEHLR
jgi:predicted dehydrogenase